MRSLAGGERMYIRSTHLKADFNLHTHSKGLRALTGITRRHSCPQLRHMRRRHHIHSITEMTSL